MADQLGSKVSVPKTFDTITKPFNPKIVAVLNDAIEFRVAKIKGDFTWHSHRTTDELFFILEGGPLTLHLRRIYDDADSEEILVLEKGDVYVVPKGVQHYPGAEEETKVLFAETKGELNTGDLGNTDRTVVIEDVRT